MMTNDPAAFSTTALPTTTTHPSTIADPSDLFAGRVAVLATMHRKEQAIAPVLEGRLGVKVVVPSGLGFSKVQRVPGLPCSLCGSPTLLTLSVRYRCQRCQFQQSRPVPDAPLTAAPSQCPYCNP